MTPEPVWHPVEEAVRDAFSAYIHSDTRIFIQRRWRLTWRERLLSWPWQPWAGYDLEEPEELLPR